MNRRKILEAVAGIIAGAELPTVVETTKDSEQIIHLVPEPHSISQTVQPDTPVTHRLAWITGAGEGPAALRAVLAVTSYQAYFNGEPLAHESDHWNSIHSIADNQWRVEWKFRLPAVAPGPHEFKLTVTYERPFTSKTVGGADKTRRGTDTLTARYTVQNQ